MGSIESSLSLTGNTGNCYDPLDPDGNITVAFDIFKWTDDGYMAKVTIQNYYQYLHVDRDGWQLGWTWASNEIILSMTGAFALQQGNCSSFKGDEIPHCCKKDPVIVDMPENAIPESRSENCCHGGMISAKATDPSKSSTSFDIKVGNLPGNSSGNLPQNVTLMAPGPGYTCSSFEDYPPTVYPGLGKREMQVFRTWKSECTYSPFVAKKVPTCCVSLSTFYSPTITQCPTCSCGCRLETKSAGACLRHLSDSYSVGTEFIYDTGGLLRCTDHMCPVRVHWHVKNNYRDHWRVKVTVSNNNYGKNYSDWNLLIQHPGLSASPRIYSFNSTLLPTVGFAEEVALLWGLKNWNEMLLQSTDGREGSVSTEILMGKNDHSFTFRNGWGLPRRIYFNGENCQMPLPDDFPMLPNGSCSLHPREHFFCLLIALYLILKQ
ncbi:hypothetical protein AQUCO_05500065v1 [Aquilegia coerulea]|uniref:COBRA-like protein n=1 Tax=Aquilegia coerulea TaxID=218851 RepID=A0A2G5CGT1_AQUCA|nr:hypothetical protein AQUCO_05500065v1 [Aquilegia coerulea]